MLPYYQIVLATSLLICGGLWRRAQTKRRNLSWDDTVRALRASDWGLERISERYLYRGGINVEPGEIWSRIEGTRGLWAMYKNAPLLIHLADCAAEYGMETDEELKALLEGLRREAFQIRMSAILGLVGCAIRSKDTASTNAHRAATHYSELLARLTALIQRNAGQLLPGYLGAM